MRRYLQAAGWLLTFVALVALDLFLLTACAAAVLLLAGWRL